MSLPFQNSAKVKIVVPSLRLRSKQTQSALAYSPNQSNQA